MKPLVAAVLASLLTLAASQAGLVEIENQFRAAYEQNVGAQYSSAVAELDSKYVGALERARQQATQADRLEEAVALKAEMQRVKDKGALPEKDEGADPAVIKFRGTYREQLTQLMADRDKAAGPVVEKFGAALERYRLELAKADKLEEALAVKDYVGSGLFQKILS